MGKQTCEIGCNMSSNGNVYIRIVDCQSRVRVCEVEMTPTEFANLITGRVLGSVAYSHTPSDKIGTRHENQYVWVPIDRDKGLKNMAKTHEKACADFCVDGWEPDIDTEFNWHRWDNKRGAYRTVFRRWVKIEEGEADA